MIIGKGKRGDISTQQIVLLIILITSFAIILFFLFRLNLGSNSEEQLCHDSVVRKASVLSSTPSKLQCSRDYICITEDGSCEGMVNPEKLKVKSAEEVYKALADEMATCWWMFGEGKVDYIGKDFFTHDNYCSVCSQILFDDSLKEINEFENGKISKDELYNYLAENEYSDGKNYAEYILGTNDLVSIKNQALEEGEVGTFGEIEIGNHYLNVMGITSEVTGRGWKIATGAGAAVLGLWGPTWVAVGGFVVGALVVGAGEVGEAITPEIGAIIVEGDSGNSFMAPTIQEINSEKFNALNCYEIITA